MNCDFIQFAAHLATILVAIIAAFTLIATVFIYKKNRKIEEPLCNIRHANYGNFISVSIANNGLSPLKISQITCTNRRNNSSFPSLFELLSDKLKGETFYRLRYGADIEGLSISPGKETYLLAIKPKDDEIRRELRDRLKDIKITIDYTDMLNKSYKKVEAKLSYFGETKGKGETNIESIKLYHRF